MFHKENAGGLIIRVMSLWYQRWLFRKYRLGFERAVKKSRGRLVIGVRIMKKNMVMKKLKWFLTECKPRPVMATVVHRFIKNVHFLQRIYHNFCKCKSARIHSIMRIWNRYEASYIKKKLREKKEKVVVGKSTSFESRPWTSTSCKLIVIVPTILITILILIAIVTLSSSLSLLLFLLL